MKSLTNYIIEKLKINKDVKGIHHFHENDEICCLRIYLNNEWDKKAEISIYQPFKIKSIDNKKIIYNVPFHNRDVDIEYYINSKGYYQDDDKENGGKNNGRIYANTIFLHPAEYKEILELILKEKVFNPKYQEEGTKRILDKLINEYFDNVNSEELNNKEIQYYDNTHNGYIEPFKRPKELKDIINTYYEKY